VARIDPDTIKLLKDRLLRVLMEVGEHKNDEGQPGASGAGGCGTGYLALRELNSRRLKLGRGTE